MRDDALSCGFADAPIDAARAFRAALEAMARPGTIHDVAGALPPAAGESGAVGEPAYPDRSATLIVEMDELKSEGAVLTGPGIRDTVEFSLPAVEAFRANARLFPLGLDFFFCAGSRLAAMPRTTKIAEMSGEAA